MTRPLKPADLTKSPENAFDNLDLTVGRAMDDALAGLEAGDIDYALEALERAIRVSESHPIFSKRAAAEFQRVEGLARVCERLLDGEGEPTAAVRALIDRVSILNEAKIH